MRGKNTFLFINVTLYCTISNIFNWWEVNQIIPINLISKKILQQPAEKDIFVQNPKLWYNKQNFRYQVIQGDFI